MAVTGGAHAARDDVVTRLVRECAIRGRAVTVVSAQNEPLDVDEPGKDSHEHGKAGAREVFIASKPRWARVHHGPRTAEPPSVGEFTAMVPSADVVIAVGFNDDEVVPRLEVGVGAIPALTLVCGDGEETAFDLDKPRPIVDLIERLSEETR